MLGNQARSFWDSSSVVGREVLLWFGDGGGGGGEMTMMIVGFGADGGAENRGKFGIGLLWRNGSNHTLSHIQND